MTEKPLLFPKNFERYLALGHEAYEKAEWEMASENFLAAYQLKADFKANVWLVKSLIAQEKWAEALEYAKEMKLDYFKSIQNLQLYIQVLNENFAFVSARKALNYCERKQKYTTEIAELRKKVSEMEAAFNLIQRAQREAELKKFSDFSSMLPIMQLGLLKKLELPLADVTTLARKYMVDKRVNPFVRQSFLVLSCEVGIEEFVELRLLDGTVKTYKPKELKPLEEETQYKMILQLAERRFADQDPVFWQSLQNELPLQLLLCYPHIEEKIPSAEKWVQVQSDWYQSKDPITNEMQEYELFKKIQSILQTVFYGI